MYFWRWYNTVICAKYQHSHKYCHSVTIVIVDDNILKIMKQIAMVWQYLYNVLTIFQWQWQCFDWVLTLFLTIINYCCLCMQNTVSRKYRHFRNCCYFFKMLPITIIIIKKLSTFFENIVKICPICHHVQE